MADDAKLKPKKTGQTKAKKLAEKSSEPAALHKTSGDFPVIGLGASAGGLEAFGGFFSKMPEDGGMAFVLVQHLDPTHVSNMVELLKRYTNMPVVEARNEMELQADHVYMIPPNHILTIKDRKLKLEAQTERPAISHNIDLFFRSLAESLGDKAICIILSGTGSDGTAGAKAVKANLGLVMVQDPATARYDGMPRSAIEAGVADIVTPVEAMASKLVDYVEHSYGRPAEKRHAKVESEPNGLHRIFGIIRARTKRNFSQYKSSTITRRIERRMNVNQLDRLEDYVRLLQTNPQEVDALVKDFLISVTSFFRDPEAFEALKSKIKDYIKNKDKSEGIRAWVPACATGEEAYSLAIIIAECCEELGKYPEWHVFGTDLDADAINSARTGVYPESVKADISPERLKKYFSKKDAKIQVSPQIRENLVFAVQDVVTDPPFSRMDVILARNLLIYFNSELQKRIIPLFNYSLNEGGLLFLGTAETVGEYTDLFTPSDRKWKIYTSHRATPYIVPPARLTNAPELLEIGGRSKGRQATPLNLEKLLMEAMPPAVLVDRDYNIIFVSGETGKYLQFPQGKPSANIIQATREELRPALNFALSKAISGRTEAVKGGVRVKVNGGYQTVRVRVRPAGGEGGNKLVVIFEDTPEPKGRSTDKEREQAAQGLEQELQFTRESLNSTIEELETANEELRSANEEYQSTNEELASTNEELETSREELQSVNEELTTVNSEHQKKIEELSVINDDMKNLLDSTRIATLFVDNDLRIKRFTPTATEILNLIDSDVGRPVSHITSELKKFDLMNVVKKVSDTLVPFSADVQTMNGNWYSMRILPYRTTENAIAGLVLTFIDISDLKRTEEALADAKSKLEKTVTQRTEALDTSESRFKTLVSASSEVLFHLNPDWSEMRQLHGRGFLTDIEKPTTEWMDLFIPKGEQARVRAAFRRAIRAKGIYELEHKVKRRDGSIGWVFSRAVPILDDKGEILEWFGGATDVTAKHKAEEKAENRE